MSSIDRTEFKRVTASAEAVVKPALGQGAGSVAAAMAVLLMFVGAGEVRGQEDRGRQEFAKAGCATCHGPTAKGGLAPGLAGQTRPYPEFLKIVREGSAEMPPQSTDDVSDEKLAIIYEWLVPVPSTRTGNERARQARGSDPAMGKEVR